jgi:hypothetical protein
MNTDPHFTINDLLRVIIVISVVGNFMLMIVVVSILWWHRRFAVRILNVMKNLVSLSTQTTADAAHQVEVFEEKTKGVTEGMRQEIRSTLADTAKELKEDIKHEIRHTAGTAGNGAH